MAFSDVITCKKCDRRFRDNSEQLYWHLKIHELDIYQQVQDIEARVKELESKKKK